VTVSTYVDQQKVAFYTPAYPMTDDQKCKQDGCPAVLDKAW